MPTRLGQGFQPWCWSVAADSEADLLPRRQFSHAVWEIATSLAEPETETFLEHKAYLGLFFFLPKSQFQFF